MEKLKYLINNAFAIVDEKNEVVFLSSSASEAESKLADYTAFADLLYKCKGEKKHISSPNSKAVRYRNQTSIMRSSISLM